MSSIPQSAILEVGNSTVAADFTRVTAKFRPALHSSGFAPNFERAFMATWDEKIKEMNFDYVRSHDLGLINCGSRAFDVQYVFPLMHLDPVALEMKDGEFTLSKPDAYSAAFLITFEF